jgi:hypothetical protein
VSIPFKVAAGLRETGRGQILPVLVTVAVDQIYHGQYDRSHWSRLRPITAASDHGLGRNPVMERSDGHGYFGFIRKKTFEINAHHRGRRCCHL